MPSFNYFHIKFITYFRSHISIFYCCSGKGNHYIKIGKLFSKSYQKRFMLLYFPAYFLKQVIFHIFYFSLRIYNCILIFLQLGSYKSLSIRQSLLSYIRFRHHIQIGLSNFNKVTEYFIVLYLHIFNSGSFPFPSFYFQKKILP